MNSQLFKIDWSDVKKGIITALFTGVALPVSAIIQSPGFDFLKADWHAIGIVALNGAIAGFVGYIFKNFLTDQNGRVFGKI